MPYEVSFAIMVTMMRHVCVPHEVSFAIMVTMMRHVLGIPSVVFVLIGTVMRCLCVLLLPYLCDDETFVSTPVLLVVIVWYLEQVDEVCVHVLVFYVFFCILPSAVFICIIFPRSNRLASRHSDVHVTTDFDVKSSYDIGASVFSAKQGMCFLV